MRLLPAILTFLPAAAILFSGCGETEPGLTTVEAEKLFVFEVYPMLQSKCFACHGDDPAETEGEFDIRSRQNMLEGGESGKPALIPGNAAGSPLYFACTREDDDFQMPPKENDRLTDDQLADLRLWINSGAPWPDSTAMMAIYEEGDWDFGGEIQVLTSGGLSKEWTNRRYKEEDLWAFQPLKEVLPPEGDLHPVDAFVNKKLNENHLSGAKKADKRTLIRRATYDLTGLPPTADEVEAFLMDTDGNAFEKVIDRLLASPHYGEQWARHWLDVTRYADSDGFSNDYARPNAWRYRDYVIRAFNEDKPYDEFIREQIAGDEIAPEDPESLIAAGFLRMGPWEHTAMSVEAETRQFFLDDVTNGVGETFLSLPLRCARCHDHKFDPVPTRDYYRIQAVFATTQFARRPAPFLAKENLNGMEEEKAWIEKWIQRAEYEQDSLKKKEEDAAKDWYRQKGKRYIGKRERRNLPDNQQPPRYLGLTFKDLGYRKLLSKHLQTLRRELGRYDPMAFSVYNGPNRLVHSARPNLLPEEIEDARIPTYILTGGSVYAPADSVVPGVVSAVMALEEHLAPGEEKKLIEPLEKAMSGRRTKFARWLSDPENGLVLRSIVNRLWQYHFGKGIAENSNNFGATGKKPTHPELLEWLSAELVRQNWSLKAMHKIIMTSEAYQRSSDHPDMEKNLREDPENHLLARFSPRRLEAEEIRDAMLAVSGELNRDMGGIPVRPEINLEVALQPRHIMGSVARAYQPSPTRTDRNRRTIYTERLRGLPNPMLTVLNQPGPDLSCERRTASAVTPQAFTQFNGLYVRKRGLASAISVNKTCGNPEDCVAAVVEQILQRTPTSDELDQMTAYLNEMKAWHDENHIPREEFPTEVLRSMFEEMTGESFEYTEQLDIYRNYEYDPQFAEAKAEVRALADLCHILFNTNEFVYVY